MNFDINMLSTLMQMLGSQKPKTDIKQNDTNSDYATNDTANKTASVFAMQNGIGQKINFENPEPKPKQSAPQQNPLSSMLEMMTGMSGTSSSNGDLMSSLMPMLFNMMSATKNTPSQNNKNANEQKQNEPSQENKSTKSAEHENTKKQMKTQPHSQDKYEPIAFAGYALISTLNKLYVSKH